MKHIYVILLISLVTLLPGTGQTGGPDTSFGNDGFVLFKTSWEDHLNELITLDDGKILVSGTRRHDDGPPWETGELAMFNPDGTIDESFGDSGIVHLEIPGNFSLYTYALRIDDDGKILVAGTMDYAPCVFRLNPDGSPDATFGTDGVLICPTAGYSFGSSSHTTLALQPDGKILVGSKLFAVTNDSTAVFRFQSDGTPDSGFGKNGLALYSFGSFDPLNLNSLTVQEDGKIVVTGSYLTSNWRGVIYRLSADGSIDTDFADNGIYINPPEAGYGEMSEVVVQPDGKILVTGTGSDRMLLIRLTEDGEPDVTFGTNGIVIGNCRFGLDLELLDDGSILVAGTAKDGFALSDMAVARFFPNGQVDSAFGDGTGKFSYPLGEDNDIAWAMRVQEDDKIVIAGTVEFPDPANTSNLRTQSFLFRYDYTAAGGGGGGPLFFSPTRENSAHLSMNISPNPVNGSTRIYFSLEETGEVHFILYDLTGRQADRIAGHNSYSPGTHSITYTPSEKLVPGIYYLRMLCGGKEATSLMSIQ